MRVIGVISGKGGVGKTIVAINLAASLYKYYRKDVLLVDANITTSHVGLYLGLYATPVTLNDVLRGTVDIKKAVYKHSSGINVVPASLRLEDLKDIDWKLVKEKLSGIFNDYEFVILDSSPGFNKESLITLETCSEALFVTNPIVHSVADLIKCKECSIELNVKQIGIIVNMVRDKKYELKNDEIRQMTGIDVIGSVHYDDAIMESIISKAPAINISKKVDREFLRISKYLIGDEPAEKVSFISRLSSLFKWMK